MVTSGTAVLDRHRNFEGRVRTNRRIYFVSASCFDGSNLRNVFLYGRSRPRHQHQTIADIRACTHAYTHTHTVKDPSHQISTMMAYS